MFTLLAENTRETATKRTYSAEDKASWERIDIGELEQRPPVARDFAPMDDAVWERARAKLAAQRKRERIMAQREAACKVAWANMTEDDQNAYMQFMVMPNTPIAKQLKCIRITTVSSSA